MSSKRDLVEAHSFNRRRLITAFVSGAPGGREVEPVRYGRTLVGGLVLAVLIVAGAAVSGFIKPAVPEKWNEKGLVIGKSSGSRFVALEKTLYPVINTTSARLILATDGKMEINTVPDDKINSSRTGVTIGIVGAPDTVPLRSRLLPTGWTACTNADQGMKVTISADPPVRADESQALLVSSDGKEWVVAGRHRYQVPQGDLRDATLRTMGLDGVPPLKVSGSWLDLTSLGTPLVSFRLPDSGRPVKTSVQGLDRVGAPVVVDGQAYVLGKEGNLQKISDFAYALYTQAGPGATSPAYKQKLSLSRSDIIDLNTVDPERNLVPADWPTETLTGYKRAGVGCLLMTARAGSAPTVALADPQTNAALTTGTTVERSVTAGRGAVVRGATADVVGSGAVYLVDSTGTRFSLGKRSEEQASLVSLGYSEKTPVPVPRSWLALFQDGPTLTARAVGQSARGQ